MSLICEAELFSRGSGGERSEGKSGRNKNFFC